MQVSSRPRGSALIVALLFWVVSVTVALFVVSVNRSLIESATAMEEKTRADIASLSQFDRVCFTLTRCREEEEGLVVDESVRLPGLPDTWDVGGAPLSLEEATIHLANASPGISPLNMDPQVFSRLLRALGVPEGRAELLVGAYGDWTDTDQSPRLNGAEGGWYTRHRNTGVQPRNHPLVDSFDELRLLRGMDEALYQRLRPFFNLPEAGSVSLKAAPPEVLAAVLDLSLREAEALAELRKRHPQLQLIQICRRLGVSPGTVIGAVSMGDATVFEIRIETRVGQARQDLRAVVDCRSSRRAPFQILDSEL